MLPRNRKAFTLAEVLLTLTIIGIVASLTVPSIMYNSQDQQLRVMWKTSFRNLDEATKRIGLDNGGTLVGSFTDTSTLRDKYKANLITVKSCDNSSSEKCWHAANQWWELTGTNVGASSNPGLILSNGALMVFETGYTADACNSSGLGVSTNTFLTNVCGEIIIDVNGFKAPNKIGKDIFYIWILSDSIKPWGSQSDKSLASINTCIPTDGGWGCAAKYLMQ